MINIDIKINNYNIYIYVSYSAQEELQPTRQHVDESIAQVGQGSQLVAFVRGL